MIKTTTINNVNHTPTPTLAVSLTAVIFIIIASLNHLPLCSSSSVKRRSVSGGPPFPPYEELRELSKNITHILDAFSQNYDKRVRPNYGGSAVEVKISMFVLSIAALSEVHMVCMKVCLLLLVKFVATPVEVGVTMYVLSISSISEVLMDFTVDFYFRQMWKDPRLQFQGPEGVKTLSVGSEFLNTMWVPDTFFVNEKTSYFHTATTSNEFLRISNSGDILRSIRLTVTASCPMDLRHFPMDSQLCNIEIESFGYTMSDIRYKWAAGSTSVGVSSEVSLPQFKVLGFRQKDYEINLSTGNYSRLACEIQFVRSMGYYLIQIYIPSSLIVVISWVSFWLNRNAAPARVYLGITTVLTMTTLMSSTNKALPKISYVKSIDVFLGTCFVMVFAALLEYATVGYLAKRIQMRKNHFAALQKMALQLQTAREEHFQAQQRQQQQANEAIRNFHHQQQQQIRINNNFQPNQQQQQTQQPGTSFRGQSGGGSQYGTLRGGGQGGGQQHTVEGYGGQYSTLSKPGTPRGGGGGGYGGEGNQQQHQHQQGQSQSQQHESSSSSHGGQGGGGGGGVKMRQLIPINPNQICGITPSDIDKYSRVVFPVCFVCFNMLYWIIYLHISNVDPGDLTLVQQDA